MGINVNVTKKESETRDFDDLPVGKFQMIISECELRESKSANNKGKPMYNFKFQVVTTGNENHDAYEGKPCWTNACLWDGALYTIVGIMKALGYEVEAGELEIPDPDEFIDKELIVRIGRTPARKGKNSDGEDVVYEAKNEPKGFYAIGATEIKVPKKTAAGQALAAAGTSILP